VSYRGGTLKIGTQEERAQARAMWVAGKTGPAIAEELGFPMTTINSWRSKEKWPLRPHVHTKETGITRRTVKLRCQNPRCALLYKAEIAPNEPIPQHCRVA